MDVPRDDFTSAYDDIRAAGGGTRTTKGSMVGSSSGFGMFGVCTMIELGRLERAVTDEGALELDLEVFPLRLLLLPLP